MNARVKCLGLLIAAIALTAMAEDAKPKLEAYKAAVVTRSAIMPPHVTQACQPGHCRFAGQSVTVLMIKEANGGVLGEMKDEFEAATGAKLNRIPQGANALGLSQHGVLPGAQGCDVGALLAGGLKTAVLYGI